MPHNKSINKRKKLFNYDNHDVVFASDMNFWKHVLKRTKQVVIIIDDKKLPKKVKKQLGGTGIGYEKIYIIAYPSLLDPSKILYKSIIFDENSAGAIDGLKHYIDSSILDVEEYLASIKKSYDSFKFLPKEARVQEILVGNNVTFPKKTAQTYTREEDSDIFVRPSFQPMEASAPNIQELLSQKSNEVTQSKPIITPMQSLIGPKEAKLSSDNETTNVPSTTTAPDITVSSSSTPVPSPVPSPPVPQPAFMPTSLTDYNMARPDDFVVDTEGQRCQKKNSDPVTRKCKIDKIMNNDSNDNDYTHDAKGNVCMKKNVGKENNQCNVEKSKDGKICNEKNIKATRRKSDKK